MNRRDWLKLSGATAAALHPAIAAAESANHAPKTHSAVERWDLFEIDLHGPADGSHEAANPYVDVELSATFRCGTQSVSADGFYDGNGVYRIRFMPPETGAWSYITASNMSALHKQSGTFECVAPTAKTGTAPNHGPVGVSNTFHFAYADGTPYYPFGTTCYAWAHQGNAYEELTLKTLATAPFNKMRMCIFPKHYLYNTNEPENYPFPRHGTGADAKNDYTRFDPAFFQHLEQRVRELMNLGIEADLIIFHPYDNWGYKSMPPEVDSRYLRYVIARFAAFRNVWWSLANEFDLLHDKTVADWDKFARIVEEKDPSKHLRSIHYSHVQYDYSRTWATHACLQSYDFEKIIDWREAWRKPLVFDEMMYEGNINARWGNLSGEEMTRRFWLCIIGGAYGGHGETFIPGDDQKLWWSHGGVLHGTSPARLAFMRKLMEESAGGTPLGFTGSNAYYLSAMRGDDVFLYYFDFHRPNGYAFPLSATKEKGTQSARYRADLIDPWEMTITPLPDTYTPGSKVALPGKPYLAVRFTKVGA